MHASLEFALEHPEVFKTWKEGSNYIAVLAARDQSHLSELLEKARVRGLRVSAFSEPDYNNELTSICIEPHPDNKRFLSSLPLAGKPKVLNEKVICHSCSG